MNDRRYELAEQHGMSKEFVDWFFDEKKCALGEHWFLMMGAMWEGWKGSREKFSIQLIPDINPLMFNDDVVFGYKKAKKEVIEVLTAAGVTVKSD